MAGTGASVIGGGWHLRWRVLQTAGGYNPAVAHLVEREDLVDLAPALSKVAANPLLFRQRDGRVKRHRFGGQAEQILSAP